MIEKIRDEYTENGIRYSVCRYEQEENDDDVEIEVYQDHFYKEMDKLSDEVKGRFNCMAKNMNHDLWFKRENIHIALNSDGILNDSRLVRIRNNGQIDLRMEDGDLLSFRIGDIDFSLNEKIYLFSILENIVHGEQDPENYS